MTGLQNTHQIRSLLQIIAELSAIFAYIWIVERHSPDWLRFTFMWGVCVAFPIFCIWKDQANFPEFSLDWGQFMRCLRGMMWFTVACTGVFVAIALNFDSYNYDGHLMERICEYVFWAFLQQVGLQMFLTRRFEKFLPNRYWVAGASATVFALIHMPNPVLVPLTWVGGFFWTLSFLDAPNLYALAVSHGWLAVMALYCVPVHWMHQLRVGPTYWTF